MEITKDKFNSGNRSAPAGQDPPERRAGPAAPGGGRRGIPAEQSQDILRRALRCSFDSITISRLSDGLLVDVNPRFEKVTGYARAEAVGKTSTELGLWKNPRDRARLVRILRRDGAASEFESEFIAGDGEVRQCVLAAEVLEIEGERYLLAAARDVTDANTAQEVLHWLGERLESERRSAVEKEAALKQVLGYMEEKQSAFRSELTSHIIDLLQPVIGKLRDAGGRLERKDVDRLEQSLERFVEANAEGPRDGFFKLTPRELDICAAIRGGLSSKEIANQFGLSVNTVHKHRQTIRRKLQLNNRDVNLAAFLRSR